MPSLLEEKKVPYSELNDDLLKKSTIRLKSIKQLAAIPRST